MPVQNKGHRIPLPGISFIVAALVTGAYLIGGLFGVDDTQAQSRARGAGLSMALLSGIPLPPPEPLLESANRLTVPGAPTPFALTATSAVSSALPPSPGELAGLESNPDALKPDFKPLAAPSYALAAPSPNAPAHARDPNGYGPATDACATCHSTHQSIASPLQSVQPEETVCFSCHDGTNPNAPNIKAQFAKASKMPIAATSGVHATDEASERQSSNFAGPYRHVECVDCHNPHKAGSSIHTPGANSASSVFNGQWGIAVSNVISWTAPVATPVSPVQYEYQVCFKCHSSWAYGANPPASPSGGFAQTDQSKEFNTQNPSYHPVEAPGKNPFTGRFGSYASSLIGGFSPAGTMYCSDCHGSETASDPKGPHGSTKPFILKGDWNRNTGRPGTSNHLCFQCHSFDVYANEDNEDNPWQTGFSDDETNLHAYMVGKRGKVCMDCHLAVPHGYQRDHLLGYNDDPAPYVNRRGGGLQRVLNWRAPGYWTKDSCGTTGDCH